MSEASGRRDSWAGRPCPVDGCDARFLTADGAGRHLDRVHDEKERWADGRTMAIDNVGEDGNSVIIADMADDGGDRWIQSDNTIEVRK